MDGSALLEEDISQLPLEVAFCVDLDGTLLLTDTLQESAIAYLFSDWRAPFYTSRWLLQGKARLKQELAARWQFEVANLPFNQPLLCLLKQEHEKGRTLILVTGADRLIAERVADYLGIFSEVIASNGTDNLRGVRKAQILELKFGKKELAYIANDKTDHAIWKTVKYPVAANASGRVCADLKRYYPESVILSERRSQLPALLRALRPYQWVKNLFVLVPIFTAAAWRDLAAWSNLLEAMIAFCLVTSAIYLLNDLSDLAADRAHPRKRSRPFASGALSAALGLITAPILFIAGLTVALLCGAVTAYLLYAVLSLSYTIFLKEQPLVDVFVLTALYDCRLLAGGEASGHAVSLWLLGFSSFVFLGLALVKRVSELLRIQSANERRIARRGYEVKDLFILQAFGAASAFSSAVVLSLYIQSSAAETVYRRPETLWALVPIFLFWQCRLWLSTARGYMHDDPILYAARDWVSWIVFACAALAGLAAQVPR